MAITIANWFDADRRSAKAGETMTMGMVVKVTGDANGERFLMQVDDADSALLVAGNYGVVYKVSADAAQVIETSVSVPLTGSRLVSIVSGDQVVEVRRGAIIEYSADLLHDSLDPAAGGATPVVGQALAIKDAQFCKADVGSAIVSPVVGRVYMVHGTNVLVELV